MDLPLANLATCYGPTTATDDARARPCPAAIDPAVVADRTPGLAEAV